MEQQQPDRLLRQKDTYTCELTASDLDVLLESLQIRMVIATERDFDFVRDAYFKLWQLKRGDNGTATD